MNTFITPIDRISQISSVNILDNVKKVEDDSSIFKDIFNNAIQNVVDTSNKVSEDTLSLSTGETDDLHNLQIDITQAQLATSLVIQLRNRFMDSYNEVMRINL